MSWSHAICEACWIERESTWSVQADGTEMLQEIRKPAAVQQSQVEQCCFCGSLTIMGIYTRHNPNELDCEHD